jgi:hypothetical protein
LQTRQLRLKSRSFPKKTGRFGPRPRSPSNPQVAGSIPAGRSCNTLLDKSLECRPFAAWRGVDQSVTFIAPGREIVGLAGPLSTQPLEPAAPTTPSTCASIRSNSSRVMGRPFIQSGRLASSGLLNLGLCRQQFCIAPPHCSAARRCAKYPAIVVSARPLSHSFARKRPTRSAVNSRSLVGCRIDSSASNTLLSCFFTARG